MSTQPSSPKKPESEQLKFLEAPIPFDIWRWRSCLHGISKARVDMQWEIGDLLVEAKDFGKMADKTLKQEAEKATKREWGTIKNYMVTSRAIPPSRRRDGRDGRPELDYSIHVEVRKFDEENQERLLKIAEEGWHSFKYDEKVDISFSPSSPQRAGSVRGLQNVIAI